MDLVGYIFGLARMASSFSINYRLASLGRRHYPFTYNEHPIKMPFELRLSYDALRCIPFGVL